MLVLRSEGDNRRTCLLAPYNRLTGSARLMALHVAKGGEMRIVTIVCLLLATQVVIAQRSLSGGSPTCGPISGQTPQDLDNVRAFCDTLPNDMAVGAYATNSDLWMTVNRSMADRIRTDRPGAEELVLGWMRDWKQLSGSQSVTVTVRWGDIRLAKGQTTRGDGDRVTVP